eukprot:c12989_g1_i1 orf=155-595(+)
MMLRPLSHRGRAMGMAQGAEERFKQQERKIAELEEKKTNAEKVKRELEEKVEELQRELQEVQRKHKEKEKEMEDETTHTLDKVQHKLEEIEKACDEGLAELESKMEERRLITSRLHDDVKASLTQLSQTLETSYNIESSHTTTRHY